MICATLFLFLHYQDDLKALEKALQVAVARNDSQEASKLARSAVDRGYVKAVVTVLPHAALRVYWALLEALRELKTEEGLASLTDEVLGLKGKPEARDLVQLVLDSKSEKKDDLISRLLDGADDPIRLACLDIIGKEERKTFIPKLIDLLDANEKGTDRLPALSALRNLTGLDLGPSAAWRRWWEKEGKTFDCPKIDSASNDDTETVIGFLRRNRRTQFEELRKGNKRRIAVIRTDGDRMERVLDKLGIPYTIASNDQVANGTFDATTTFAILENCGAAGGKPVIHALRIFVDSGGALFFSDGSMDLIWATFPGYGAAAGGRNNKELVEILPARGSLSEPLMREVFDDRFTLEWKLHLWTTFRAKSEKLVTLIEGPDLGSRKGTSAPLAGYFRHGDKGGMVAFVAGHFTLQETKEGEFTLQNLLLNFLIEAQENFRAREGR